MVRPIERNPVVIDTMASVHRFRNVIVEVVNLAQSKLSGEHRYNIENLIEGVETIQALIRGVSPDLVGKWVTAYVKGGSNPPELLTTHAVRIVSKIFTVVCRRSLIQ